MDSRPARRPFRHLGRLALPLVLAASLTLSGCGYNDFQRLDEQTRAAWSEVLNQYQRRADLIPNLVETVKGEAAFEQETLTRVIEARARATSIQVTPGMLDDPQALERFQQAQGQLGSALSRLLAVAENYPDLKANASFGSLQQRISELENQIADRREFYNDTVTIFNTRIQQIPASWVAGGRNLQPAELFKNAEADREDVKIEFKLSA